MDPFELKMTLGESGIDLPDKCKACPHLGKLAARLSQAQENRNFLIVSSDEEVLTANIRSQLTSQMKTRFPGATDEQVASTVDNSIANFMNSDGYPEALMNAGTLLEEEDANIATALGKIAGLLSDCPPGGCGTD